jgi:hypothetical protein
MSDNIMDDRYVSQLEQQVIDLQAEVVALYRQVRRWEDKEVDRAVCCAHYEERCKELEALLAHSCTVGCGECVECDTHNNLSVEERIAWMRRLDAAIETI